MGGERGGEKVPKNKRRGCESAENGPECLHGEFQQQPLVSTQWQTDYKRWKRRLRENKQRNKVLSSFPEANIIVALPYHCVPAARI